MKFCKKCQTPKALSEFWARSASLDGKAYSCKECTRKWGVCGICKDFVSEKEFHVDHVIPLSRGGQHGYINVQPAHPFCNMSKGNRS